MDTAVQMFFLFIFFAILICTPVSSAEMDSTIRKLRRNLLKGYDNNARPVISHKNTTVVEAMVHPRLILELDERSGIFILDAFLKMTWNDEYLKWDPDEYNGLKSLHFADHEIWQPDIIVYNTDGSSIDQLQKTLNIVYNTGLVLRVPLATFRLICPLDYKDFPDDIQFCEAKLASWTTDGNAIDLRLPEKFSSETNTSESAGLEVFKDINPFWKLENFEASRHVLTFSCCEEPYISLTFAFALRRRSLTTHQATKLLGIVAHVLLLSMFWLPSDSLGKIILGLTGVMCQVATLLITVRSTASPAFAETAFSYLKWEFSASLAAIIFEVIVINLATNWKTPKFLNSTPSKIMKALKVIFCLCGTSSSVEAVTYPSSVKVDLRPAETESVKKRSNWFSAATVVERIAFGIFFIVFLCIGNH